MDGCHAAGRAGWLRAARPDGRKPAGAVARGRASLGSAPAATGGDGGHRGVAPQPTPGAPRAAPAP
eukprot:798791-Lingulodinium_polyedra.AAC.1